VTGYVCEDYNTGWTKTNTADITVSPGATIGFVMTGWDTGMTLNAVAVKCDVDIVTVDHLPTWE